MSRTRTFADAAPKGWISKDELLAETGISERSLAEWAQHLGLRTCLVSRGRDGVEAYYAPDSILTIKRLLKLRAGTPRGKHGWLWQLWIEGFDVDIRRWAKKHLGSGLKGLTRRNSSGYRLIRNRVRGQSHRATLEYYAGLATSGQAGPAHEVTLHNADPPIFDLLLKISGLPNNVKPFTGELKNIEQRFAFPYLTRVLDTCTEDEIEQARRDWQTLARWVDAAEAIDWSSTSPEVDLKIKALMGAPSDPPSWRARKAQRQRPWPPPPLVQGLIALWPELAARAAVLPFGIDLRRSSTLAQFITEGAAMIDLAFERMPRRPGVIAVNADRVHGSRPGPGPA